MKNLLVVKNCSSELIPELTQTTQAQLEVLKKQVEFNIDRSVCYCIGSRENYEFLKLINEKFNFFDKIIPLEHPRFIMQYNSKNKDYYLKKYLTALTENGKGR